MPSPSTINFDGVNLLITLPLGVRNISVQEDIYSDWKVWATQGDNLKYPPAFRSAGGDPLAPGITAGAYYFLRNDLGWRIKPAEESATTFLEGNLAPEDSTAGIFVPTDGAFTHAILGLQPITQSVAGVLEIAQANAYAGAVYIDTESGTAGTSYPIGTQSVPVSNLADALAIATANGFKDLYLRGGIVLTAHLPGFTIAGVGTTANVDLNGQVVDGLSIKRCGVFGTIGGHTSPESLFVLEECTIFGAITNFDGVMTRCILQGDVFLRGNTAWLYECASGVAGTDPGGNLDASTATELPCRVVIRNYNGGIGFRNFTQSPGAVITCGVNTGKINIRASCTNFADFQARGTAELNNESALEAGVDKAIDTAGLVEPQDGRTARKLMQNRMHTDPVAGTLTIYDDDDTTVFLQADLFEDVAATQPYRGRGADRRNRMT